MVQMLTIANSVQRSEKETQWPRVRSKPPKTGIVQDAIWENDGFALRSESPHRRPSSAVSTSSFAGRRDSEAPLTCIENKLKRPVSEGPKVKRNSSNRSTVSEGSKRRVRKGIDSSCISKAPNFYEDSSTFGISNSGAVQVPSTSPSSVALTETAASLLRLVLPFSWERKNNRNSRLSPAKEVIPVNNTTGSLSRQHEILVPFPQRSAPPIPSSGCSLCGDHISVSSHCSSLAGHTYEQVPFCPKSVIEDGIDKILDDDYEYVEKNIDSTQAPAIESLFGISPSSSLLEGEVHLTQYDICIPGEIREVRRPSRKRKKSRNKGTFTEGRMTQTESFGGDSPPPCVSISLPQKKPFFTTDMTLIGQENEQKEMLKEVLKDDSNSDKIGTNPFPELSSANISNPVDHQVIELPRTSSVETRKSVVFPNSSESLDISLDVSLTNLDLISSIVSEDSSASSQKATLETFIPEPPGLASSLRRLRLSKIACKDQENDIASNSENIQSNVTEQAMVTEENGKTFNSVKTNTFQGQRTTGLLVICDRNAAVGSSELGSKHFVDSIEIEGSFEGEIPPAPHSSPDRREHLKRFLDCSYVDMVEPESLEEKVGCERYRVEGEMCRVQEALSERLGPPAVMLKRRDQRLHAINAIEKAIQRLRQENRSLSPAGARDRPPLSGRNYNNGEESCSRKSQGSESELGPFDTAMDLVNANELDETCEDRQSAHSSSPSNESSEVPSRAVDEECGENGYVEDGAKLNPTLEAVLRGSWPFEKALWHSSPATVGGSYKNGTPETTPGIMSTSSVTNRRAQSQQQLLTNKVEMVYGLLSMFSSGDRDDMSRTLLAMSSSPDSCVAMRQSGCLPLLIQLLHGTDDTAPTREARLRAAQALHNIVHSHPDDKRGRREARVLRLLEQLRDYSDSLWEKLERVCAGRGPLLEDAMERHPCPAMAALMKLSFDEEHRHAMCALGGLHAIAELIRRDHEAHGSQTADQYCTTLRRYAGMALTNLTFGDGTNKALLCSFRSFMKALVSQLHSPSEELRQVTASVLRNLSWRADGSSKISLREVGAVTALTDSALTAKKESTLKVMLSAVWNLSAHCSMNKCDICTVDGALAFICSTLTYKSHSKTLSIIENGGGILRNISSHIAVRDDLRQVLRDHSTLNVLLGQLRSPSLTVVSNACGTLWNLSARCPQDQATLWNLGAVPMLRSLINSKHKMISMGSSAALKNLLQAKPEGVTFNDGRSGLGLPSLQARKQKALEQELDPSLAETCDNIESSPRASPTNTGGGDPMYHSLGHYNNAILSDSRDSILSTHSDKTHDRMQQMLLRHHNGRESELGGERPVNGVAQGVDNNFSVFNKYGKGSDSSFGCDVSAKVSSLGNKYLNGKSKSNHFSDKPIPQIDNYVKEDDEDASDKDLEDEDQPTNFSLRYSEDKDDQEQRKRSGGKEEGAQRNGYCISVHDDSIRTFCTEGTPYNFSTATSLSDLREIDRNSSASDRVCKPKHIEEDYDIDIEALNDSDVDISSKEEKRHVKPPVRSGSSSDKPVTYCVEGTPVSLSRIPSVSSISSEEIDERIDKELLEDDDEETEPACLPSKPSERNDVEKTNAMRNHTQNSNQAEVQPQVDGHLQICDQTPLMFSRATSVSSLSSFEIQSIHDDRSSVVSDFSRLASGIASPSDLPDSPSQTVPSSPKRARPPLAPATSHVHKLPHPHQGRSTGVFHDCSRAFNDEGTPIEYSHGTSLSSLTFDEEDFPLRSRGDGKDSSTTTSETSQHELDSQCRPSRDPVRSSIPRPPHTRSQDPERRKGSKESSVTRTSSEGPPHRGDTNDSSEDAEDERRLAAVIMSGMPSSKKSAGKAPMAPPVAAPRVASSNRTILLPPPPPPPPPPGVGGLCSAIPIQTPNLQVTVQALNLFSQTNQKVQQNNSGNWSGSDSVHGFCTENTPANVSYAGSNSDLSQLSMPTSYGRSSHNESADSEDSIEGKRLLEKCIRSGMPKPKMSQRALEPSGKDRPLLSPRRSPHHQPVPVARVIPAVKVGIVNPQVNYIKSPNAQSSFSTEEVKTYAVEGTPVEFSPAASLSDLTVDTPPHLSSHRAYKGSSSRMAHISKGAESSGSFSPDEVPKRFGVENTPSNLSRHSSYGSGLEMVERPKSEDPKVYGMEGTPVLYSHNSSLSSLSVESETTTPREEALLRKCINQGMPRGPPSRIPQAPGRGISPRVTPGVPMQHLHLSRVSTHVSTAISSEAESKKLYTENEESEKQSPRKLTSFGASSGETSLESLTNQGHDDTSDESARTVIPQHWKDVRPSITEEKVTSVDGKNGMEKSSPSSGSFEMRSDASLSESNVVLAEALKVAKAVSKDGNRQGSSDEVSVMSASIASASSVCLDLIKPPSAMGSLLSLSTSSVEEAKTCKQPVQKKMECRHTKKLPEMVRRALGEQDLLGHQNSDGASLASSCHSNIDNIFPPSLVDDDMESSMISVASITSEVVENSKDSPPGTGISIATEALSEIVGPARHIASLLQREAQGATSSLTLTAGDEASTYQEITDLDETLGPQQPDDIVSDTEVAVDDLPQDIPDLPQDSPIRRHNSLSAKGSPKLTPGPRRSHIIDRYKTFTRDGSSPDSSRETPEPPRSPAVQRTAKQRRSNNSDRFLTRTISCETPPEADDDRTELNGVEDLNDEAPEKITPVQNENENFSPTNNARRSFKQRRSENPSRYQTRTIEMPVNDFIAQANSDQDEIVEFHDGEDLCLTQAQMEVLSQDANIVICSLNETREAMTTSDAADFSEENILDIETLSLISNDEEEMYQLISENPPEDDEALAKGPRIVKPGEEQRRHVEQEPPEKAIRGKRKALYSSGRHQGHVPCSTKAQTTQPYTKPTSSNRNGPAPIKPLTTSPKQPRATRASTLRQNNKVKCGSSSDDSRPGSSPGSSAGSSPKLGNSSRPISSAGKAKSKETLLPFKRQNTFTKDDAEQTSLDKKRAPQIVQQRVTKGRVRRDVVQPSQSYPAANVTACSDWNSRSRQNGQKSVSLTRDAQPPSVSDMAEWGADAGHAKGTKGVKKDVTSRIASLWKKVEKAQTTKPQKGKDDRVWISSSSKGAKEAPPPNRPLVRSSTFEKEGQSSKGRTGLGLKLSRLKGRDTRSSPPSEASTPVDLRPHCLVSPTRVSPRPRPATHPSATPRAAHEQSPDDGKEKRLSRLGSFIVVDESEDQPVRGRAVVAPFSYRNDIDSPPSRASSITRIPQPSKPLLNNPRDDNGNAAVIN